MSRQNAFVSESEPKVFIIWNDKTVAEVFLFEELGYSVKLRELSIREFNKPIWSNGEDKLSSLEMLKTLKNSALDKPLYTLEGEQNGK